MNIAIVLAAGSGTRVGAEVPKQFIEVLGRPVLSYSIEIFERHPEVDLVEVVCRAGWEDKVDAIVAADGFSKVFRIACGGATFQDSVRRGIDALADRPDSDIVLVHYGASPFTSPEVVSDAIRVCALHGNAAPARSQTYLAATRGDGTGTEDFLDRDEVMCLNTPQALGLGYARRIYDQGARSGLLSKVDPHTTSLMAALGERIWFSADESSNIKITTPQDLRLFEGWLLAGHAQDNAAREMQTARSDLAQDGKTAGDSAVRGEEAARNTRSATREDDDPSRSCP